MWRAHVRTEAKARIHWSANGVAVGEPVPLEDVKGILPLGDGEGALRPVTVNLDPEEPGSGSKVPELEVRAQLVLHTLDGVLGLRSNGDIVHKHGDDDTHSVSEVDPDPVELGGFGRVPVPISSPDLLPKTLTLRTYTLLHLLFTVH